MTKEYTVKEGDTLSKIAEEQLGDASRWHEIFEANREIVADPNLIKAGLHLILPVEDAGPKGPPKHKPT